MCLHDLEDSMKDPAQFISLVGVVSTLMFSLWLIALEQLYPLVSKGALPY